MADALGGRPALPAGLDEIESALSRAVAGQEERTLYRLSSSTNMIVLASCRRTLSGLNALIDSLSMVHPGRYFAVYRDEALPELRVEVSARCYQLGKGESLCSEVIMIGAASQGMPAVPSLIFAHLLTGNPVELFLCDPCSRSEAIDLFLPAAESVLLQSSHYLDRPQLLERIADHADIVDLEWIALVGWRRQVARAFDRASARRLLPELTDVRVSGNLGSSFQPWLLAGWIVDRLDGRLADGGESAMQIERGGGATVRLQLQESQRSEGLSAVSFEFGKGLSVRVEGGEGIVMDVETEEHVHVHEPAGTECWDELLRQYFEVGESTVNFPAALRIAMQLRHAWG